MALLLDKRKQSRYSILIIILKYYKIKFTMSNKALFIWHNDYNSFVFSSLIEIQNKVKIMTVDISSNVCM